MHTHPTYIHTQQGTAATEEQELLEAYNLSVVPVCCVYVG